MRRPGPWLLLALATAACASTSPGPGAAPEIRVRDIPAKTVLVRAFTGPYSAAEAGFERFAAHLLSAGIAPTGDLTGVYLDDPSSVPPDRTRYEIRIPVAAGTVARLPYTVREVPAFRAAAVRLRGPYGEIAQRYGGIFDWITGQGLVPAGPLHEVYLLHAGSGVPPSEYETEVLVPVASR